MKKILFVDDEQSILNIASEYFKHKGYQVLTAQNGLEAQDILESEKIDCCFTDINMPGMNGLELAEYIRHADNTIPVIIMTGFPSLENTIQTLKNGVVDFLIKPVNLNQMELCVRRVFSQRTLFVENLLLKKEVESKAQLETLNRELTVKVEELNVLNNILSNFAVIDSTTNVFTRLVDMALEITHGQVACFFVINDATRRPFEVARSASECFGADAAIDHLGRGKESVPQDELSGLVLETAADEIPLLASRNTAAHSLPDGYQSLMVVPLKIRRKVFGVLTAGILHGDRRFDEKDLYYLTFMSQSAANAIENLALYENIYENLFSTLYAFVNAIEVRDRYTQQHSSRVTGISIEIGKAMGCSPEDLGVLNFAGHLHDIGKIGIRDDILLKPGKLTPDEFEKIKQHPEIGANIVGQLGLWERERLIIHCHHERYDGTGYPDGLAGQDIPQLARILSVADVFDAISSDRSYRKRMAEGQILKIITEGSGSQFDPEVVDTFLALYHRGVFNRSEICSDTELMAISAKVAN